MLGGSGLGSGLGGANININGLETGMAGGSRNSPSAYEVQMKECEDVLALQGGLYQWALTQQNQRFQDRQTIDQELFGLYKSQVDADFGLYKSTRDELFKAWFGDNIDTKIIESAINFWFKDDDYKGGCKIWKYFKEA